MERQNRKLFLGYDADLWDLVIDGYTHPIDDDGKKVERKVMNEQQKIDFKNHHMARTILLDAISHTEYEKIKNRDTAHDLFESLKMTHEGNTQVKEIELKEDKPQKKEESSGESSSSEEDELTLLSRRRNQLWDDSESEDNNANIALMADTDDDAHTSGSDDVEASG